MLERLRGYVPIRKIITALVTGGLSWLALRSGLDLGDDAVNQAVPLITGVIFGYLEKDAKVKQVIDVLGDEPAKKA